MIESSLGYLLAGYNIFSFILMGLDKGQAKRGGRRVPEKTLLGLTFLGGGLGTFLGSRAFHHKTKKAPFPISLPLGAVITVVLFSLTLM